jgi:hypothetical protein
MTENDLLELYQILLKEYERILTISQMIREELQNRKDDERMSDLVEQKRILGENVDDLTHRISVVNVKNSKDPNLQNLSKIKSILSQIDEVAAQIQKTEEDIQSLL